MSVFAQVAFQFCGHLDEFLIGHADEVALLYLQTRFGSGGHLLRRYEHGRLVEERHYPSCHTISGYYFRMWRTWHAALRRFARSRDGVTAIFTHPLLGVGLAAHRRVRSVFWQWDFFPGNGLTERAFNSVARHCAARATVYHPLTAAIGRAMGQSGAPVLMLGVTPPSRFGNPDSKRLLMVGQLRHGQGVEHALDFIATHPDFSLALLGAPSGSFGDEIRTRIAAADMADRVFFPGAFVDDKTLRETAATCFAALALYDTSPGNLTHYADPGKVKSSIEMGLPVVMTRISEIVPFVERFKAGVVIDSLAELPDAILRLRQDPATYFAGCRAFATHFDISKHYAILSSGISRPDA